MSAPIPKSIEAWIEEQWPYSDDIRDVSVSLKREGARAMYQHLSGAVGLLIHLNSNLDLRSIVPDEVVDEIEQAIEQIGIGGEDD